MHIRPSFTGRVVLLLLAAFVSCQLACVGGHIPPSMFQFTNVVPYTGPGGGGWKVAQVLILLGKISPMFSAAATCDVEVGVPERSGDMWVTNEFAQVEAAKAADQAARRVLREYQPTAVACFKFREYMQSVLTDKVSGTIPGARVTGFQKVGLPRKTFP